MASNNTQDDVHPSRRHVIMNLRYITYLTGNSSSHISRSLKNLGLIRELAGPRSGYEVADPELLKHSRAYVKDIGGSPYSGALYTFRGIQYILGSMLAGRLLTVPEGIRGCSGRYACLLPGTVFSAVRRAGGPAASDASGEFLRSGLLGYSRASRGYIPGTDASFAYGMDMQGGVLMLTPEAAYGMIDRLFPGVLPTAASVDAAASARRAVQLRAARKRWRISRRAAAAAAAAAGEACNG